MAGEAKEQEVVVKSSQQPEERKQETAPVDSDSKLASVLAELKQLKTELS